MKKLILQSIKLNESLNKLKLIQELTEIPELILIDATIKRFEYTFDLLWKTLRVFFLLKGLDIHYPKDVLKEAYFCDLLDDEIVWLRILQDFNLTILSYDNELAAELYKRIIQYIPILANTSQKINKLIHELSLN